MRLGVKKNENLSYLRIFLIFILISVSVLLIGILFQFINYQNSAVQLMSNSIQDNMFKISRSAKLLRESVLTLLSQMNEDDDIEFLLYGGYQRLLDLAAPIERLESYINATPHIHSIYIFNGKKKVFFSPEHWREEFSDFQDTWVKNLLFRADKPMHLRPIPRIINSDSHLESTDVYTFLYLDRFNRTGLENNYIIINVNTSWVEDFITSLQKNSNSSTVILDTEGRLLSKGITINGREFKFLDNLAEVPPIQAILSDTMNKNYAVQEVENEKFLITYVQSDIFDWTYVNFFPYRKISQSLTAIRLIAFSALGIALGAGILLSFFASKKIYAPISTLLKKLKRLENEKKDSSYVMKQQILRRILTAKETFSIDFLQKKLSEYEIPINTDTSFRLYLCKINNFSRFTSEHSPASRDLFRFGITKLIEELKPDKLSVLTVNMQSDHIAAVFYNTAENNETINSSSEIAEIAEKIRTSVRSEMGIELSIAVSSGFTGGTGLTPAYRQAAEVIRYRLYPDYGNIIFASAVEKKPPETFEQPEELEKKLVMELLQGNIDAAKSQLSQIIDKTRGHTVDVLQMTLIHLARLIFSKIPAERFPDNTEYDGPGGFDLFISAIDSAETSDDIMDQFDDLFNKFSNSKIDKQKLKNRVLIDRLISRIQEYYTEPGLYTESLADFAGLSPAYIGRIFKNSTGMSIPDFINDVRLTQASRLLIETDDPVQKISQSVGITNGSYFYTLFKKKYGLTPSEFRLQKKVKAL